MGKKVKRSKQLKFCKEFEHPSMKLEVSKHASWEGWEDDKFAEYDMVTYWDHTDRTFGAIAM